MVAKITSPKSIRQTLIYHEKKVQRGVAQCIYAGNFLQELRGLNFVEKLHRFTHLIELNNRATTNTLHISLNFDPTEQLDKERLIGIAAAYVQKIGFGNQPYLVYEHRDAAHPHIHIVTTTIQENGMRIHTFNIGRNQSEKARKEIEHSFGLQPAEGKRSQITTEVLPIKMQKIRYAKSETKRSITAVLNYVLRHYQCSSLPELNAVLRLYNVRAERCGPEDAACKNQGLIYYVQNERGNRVSAPIKASSIQDKPTLKNLEIKFEQNKQAWPTHARRIKTAIDWVLHKKPGDFGDFKRQLEGEKISVGLHQNKQEAGYDITFIDHRTGLVCLGNSLGKAYSTENLQKRFLEAANDIKKGHNLHLHP